MYARRFLSVAKIATIAALCMALFPTVSFAQSNLLVNPGFEDTPLVWTLTNSSATISGTQVRSGSLAARVVSNSSVTQTVDMTPGVSYTLAAWFYRTTTETTGLIRASCAAGASGVIAEYIISTADAVGSWVEYTLPVQHASCTSVTIRLGGVSTSVSSSHIRYIDDTSFTAPSATPTPTNTPVPPTNTPAPTNTPVPPTAVPDPFGNCFQYVIAYVPEGYDEVTIDRAALLGGEADVLLVPRFGDVEIYQQQDPSFPTWGDIPSEGALLSDFPHSGAAWELWNVGSKITFRGTPDSGSELATLAVCNVDGDGGEWTDTPPPTPTSRPDPDLCEVHSIAEYPDESLITITSEQTPDPLLVSYIGTTQIYDGDFSDGSVWTVIPPGQGVFLSQIGDFPVDYQARFQSSDSNAVLKVCVTDQLPTPTPTVDPGGGPGENCAFASEASINPNDGTYRTSATSGTEVKYIKTIGKGSVEYSTNGTSWTPLGSDWVAVPLFRWYLRGVAVDPYDWPIYGYCNVGDPGAPAPTATPPATSTPIPPAPTEWIWAATPTPAPSPTGTLPPAIVPPVAPCNNSFVTVSGLVAGDPRMAPDAAVAWQAARSAVINAGAGDYLGAATSDTLRPIEFYPVASNQVWKSWHKTGRAVDLPQTYTGLRHVQEGSYERLYIDQVDVTAIMHSYGFARIPSNPSRPEWWHFEYRAGYTWKQAMAQVHPVPNLQAVFPDEDWSFARGCYAAPTPTMTATATATATGTATPTGTATATSTATPTPTGTWTTPTLTPFTTLTPLPTWTPLATYTPFPTWTAGPSPTMYPTSEIPTGTPEIGIPPITGVDPPTDGGYWGEGCSEREPFASFCQGYSGIGRIIEAIGNADQYACQLLPMQDTPVGGFEIPTPKVQEGFCWFVNATERERWYMRLASVFFSAMLAFLYTNRTIRRVGDV